MLWAADIGVIARPSPEDKPMIYRWALILYRNFDREPENGSVFFGHVAGYFALMHSLRIPLILVMQHSCRARIIPLSHKSFDDSEDGGAIVKAYWCIA